MKYDLSPRIILIVGLVLVAAGARIALSAVPNVSPMTAVAIFSGVYLADRRLALLVPLAAMLIGDLVLGLHTTIPFVYAAFALTTLMGVWLSTHWRVSLLIVITLASSILFFLVTNFGVWITTGYYGSELSGLIMCYVAAIPFFQYTLLGDLFFVGLIFGVFMAFEILVPAIKKPDPHTIAQ